MGAEPKSHFPGVPRDVKWIHSRCHYNSPLWVAISESRQRVYFSCGACGRLVADLGSKGGGLGLGAQAGAPPPEAD